MYHTADGYEVKPFEWYWDNNLDLVKIVAIADWAATELEPAWHKTHVVRKWDGTTGDLPASHSDSTRLARFHPFTREDAWAARQREEDAWERQQHNLNV